jgi:16S rRNA (adenine1518-N6/adenine1519-N6)-dimethyltransferase
MAGPGSRVLEIGAGLGSLTIALAAAGAEVVAIEVDRKLMPALAEAIEGAGRVRLLAEDALGADWAAVLGPDPGPWTLAANLPYNVAVPVIMRVLETEPRVQRLLVMVQKEVGERLTAGPGDAQYGAVSVRVAYWAEAQIVRRVPRSVFWPEPNVDSVLVLMQRRLPPDVPRTALWRVIEESFAQRRKTMRSAVVRLGYEPDAARIALDLCGVDPMTRPERLGLAEFACLARLMIERESS